MKKEASEKKAGVGGESEGACELGFKIGNKDYKLNFSRDGAVVEVEIPAFEWPKPEFKVAKLLVHPVWGPFSILFGLSAGAGIKVSGVLKLQGSKRKEKDETVWSVTAAGGIAGEAQFWGEVQAGGMAGISQLAGVTAAIYAKPSISLKLDILPETNLSHSSKTGWRGFLKLPAKVETPLKVEGGLKSELVFLGQQDTLFTLKLGEWHIATAGAALSFGHRWPGGYFLEGNKPYIKWGKGPETQVDMTHLKKKAVAAVAKANMPLVEVVRQLWARHGKRLLASSMFELPPEIRAAISK
ncbi:MAG: hypothetical protein JW797_20275 [Bradymonadales bacterium]|nr:hypothetical protein [Bradymonadales bacterium]